MKQERSDEDLVRLVRQGDTHAFDALVQRYVRAALAVGLEYTHDRDEAEDLAQDAFLRALRNLQLYDDRLPFKPWFFTILRNLARNYHAQRSVRTADAPEVSYGVQEDTEVRDIVHAELDRMTALQGACFRLCEIEGFSAPEVAAMLGLAAATVRTHVHRARLKLRDHLTRLGYGSPE